MSDKPKQFIGDRIKFYRKELHITQADLAQQMGMARTTIVAIEKQQRPVTEDEIATFEVALSLDKDVLKSEPTPTNQRIGIHIYYGHNVSIRERDEKCWNCDKKPMLMYHTYFGAPLCAHCWDTWWRTTEDGESDPPSKDIKNPHSGEWL